MDTMIFLAVMVVAISVTVQTAFQMDDSDSSAVLESIAEVQVRLSDFTDLEDDTLVFLSDVIAYDIDDPEAPVFAYISDVMEVFCHGRGYYISFDHGKVTLGDGEGILRSEASIECELSTGGRLHISLSMYSR